MDWVKKAVIPIIFLIMLAGLSRPEGYAAAQDITRTTVVTIEYTRHEWWLVNWADSQILCQVLIDHEGLPSVAEVGQDCGDELALQWQITPPCSDLTQCSGLYVQFIAAQPAEREVTMDLPLPDVWVELEGCNPIPPENLCNELPVLVFKGEEPLPEERIIAIQGLFDGMPFFCSGDICKLALRPTILQGSTIEFWADSSFGDSSEHFMAHIRVIDSGFSPEPSGSGYYVDVVSTQWLGNVTLASCARIWEAFPPVGGMPYWLSTPERHELIATENPYYYLAGRLIFQGLVDIQACPAGGLMSNGYADSCGLEMARPLVEEWQNQFDQQIIKAANNTGIPAQLMKNLFAQESQFWPGVFRVPYEFGLGQLTDSGTDAVLLWNTDFFKQFCPLVLSADTCGKGYLGLYATEKALLRGALAVQAKSDCQDCSSGIDLTDTNFTIQLFANTLQANCAQVSRSIYTATEQMAGRVSTYEDLWRFTIANYHAGPGCVSYAIHKAWEATQELTWANATQYFTEPCMGVLPYVEKITR